jgi:hypothetical protein
LGESFGMVDDPDSRKPTLNDARARVARAKEHISILEDQCASIASPDKTITMGMHNVPVSGVPLHIPDAPPILSILVGETIYNLRAALDYFMYELVYLDCRKRKSNTNFPIKNAKEEWNKFVSPGGETGLWFNSLTSEHQTAIKDLQPCFGCAWVGELSGLSNPDKHRRLTFIKADTAPNVGDSTKTTNLSLPMMMTLHFTGEITFEDGAPVVETLKLFHEQVSDVIETFNSGFL